MSKREELRKKLFSKSLPDVDFKKLKIKLKDGDSIRVRIPNAFNYDYFNCHESFNAKIYPSPCRKDRGECAYCQALELSEKLPSEYAQLAEDLKELKLKTKWELVFYDIDEGLLRVLTVAPKHAKALVQVIEEYEDALDSYAFKLSRSGSSTDTTYSLTPILKLNNSDAEKFKKFEEIELTDDFVERVRYIPEYSEQIERLKAAGRTDDFIKELQKLGTEDSKEIEEDEEVIPIDDQEEETDFPF